MRINSLLAVFVAGLTLAVTGCGSAYVPEETPASASAQVTAKQPALSSSSDQTVTEMAGSCPLEWTCDFVTYYTTKTACTTACGADPCTRDYNCNGSCICP